MCIGDIVEVCQLIFDGADVNGADECGSTALHMAVLLSDEDGVRLLLQHGAEVNKHNKKEVTPLHYAANPGYPGDIAEILVEHKAMLSADCAGFTAMQIACGAHPEVPGRNLEVAKVLEKAMEGALVGDLSLVVLYSDVDRVEAEKKDAVWVQDGEGDAISQWAAQAGDIRTLLYGFHLVLWPSTQWEQVEAGTLEEWPSVKQAYYRAIKVCHPDRLLRAKVRSQSLRRHAAALFDVLKKAHANFKDSLDAFGSFDTAEPSLSPRGGWEDDNPFSTPGGTAVNPFADLEANDDPFGSPVKNPFPVDDPFAEGDSFAEKEDNPFAEEESNPFV